MRALKGFLWFVAILLMLPFFLLLRLFGWQPAGRSTIQSLFPRERPGYAIVSPEESESSPYPYIHVNDDGSARELHITERQYLETPFVGVDSGRPYVKSRYTQKNGWGDIGGFLKRKSLPRGIEVGPAPIEDPNQNAEEKMMHRLRENGCDIVQNSDGGYTITGSKMFKTDL